MLPCTFTELNNTINSIMDKLYTTNIRMYNTCDVLKKNGLRFNEINALNWLFAPPDSYSLLCSKTNVFRYISISNVNVPMQNYILTGDYSELIIFHTSFLFTWKGLNLPIFYTENQNNIVSHIFRYYFIRNLQNQGFTPQEIANAVKHDSLNSTISYLNKKIYIHK